MMTMTPIFPMPERLMLAIEAATAAGRQSDIGQALTVAARTIEKAVKARAGDDRFEPQRIVQRRGPTLLFDGALLAEYSTKRHDDQDRWQIGEIWETRGGAYVAVLAGCSEAAGEDDHVTATIIEPGDDEQARRIAVLDALNWTIPARSMARDIGWRLEREVM